MGLRRVLPLLHLRPGNRIDTAYTGAPACDLPSWPALNGGRASEGVGESRAMSVDQSAIGRPAAISNLGRQPLHRRMLAVALPAILANLTSVLPGIVD